MIKKVLLLAILVSAVAIGIFGTADDSEADLPPAEDGLHHPPHHHFDNGKHSDNPPPKRPLHDRDGRMGPPPLPHGAPASMPPMVGNDIQSPSITPPQKVPEYNHDVAPEDFKRLIPQIICDDITRYDPGFIEDAIEYAKGHGMFKIAFILKERLAENFESYLRTTSTVSVADIRASGLDDSVEEADDIAVVEEAEDEEPTVFVEEETPIVLKPFSPPAEPHFVLLEL